MSGLILILKLMAESFSLKKGLRKTSFRRFIVIFGLFPVLTITISINWFFMLLDEVLFFWYRKVKTDKTVFIVGVPRTGTTLLYQTLAQDKSQFTSFKMWELIFAPSIIQKYFYFGFIYLDRLIGSPLLAFSKLLDRWFFGKLKGIHDMSLSKPEEDEVLLIYIFSSVYLFYVFPGTDKMDDLLLFDEQLSAKKRARIMGFYKRCVQRHLLVFGGSGSKQFLSKNPSFVAKLTSLKQTFPKAKLLYTYRTPADTIPSTISLNKNIYNVFANIAPPNPLIDRTKDLMIRWYQMSCRSIVEDYQQDAFVAPYTNITTELEGLIESIYSFLGLQMEDDFKKVLAENALMSKTFKSRNKYDRTIGVDRPELALELGFILPGDI
ncbi:MAG: hypothetical protein ACI9J3_001596 [Parvicellaceae bacterium]|jgi:hypothetical protein